MIAHTDDDDLRFIALANQLLESAVAVDRPAEVLLVRIDGWFDAKWLNFTGKIIGAVPAYQKPITIPPFHPNRVVAETHFAFSETGAFEPAPAPRLHIAQSSAENFTRWISRVSQSAIFFWFSSSTLKHDRGSTMLYRVVRGEVFSWYASFHRSPEWRLDRHLGISPSEIRRQLEPSSLRKLADLTSLR